MLRGGELQPEVLAEAARENAALYGFFGLSVFAETSGARWEDIAEERLARAPLLAVFAARDLRASGLDLWDTGRSPHYDVVHSNLDELISKFVGCSHRLILNPHYRVPEGGA